MYNNMNVSIKAFLCCLLILAIPTVLFYFTLSEIFLMSFKESFSLSCFFLMFLYLILDIWFDVRDIKNYNNN